MIIFEIDIAYVSNLGHTCPGVLKRNENVVEGNSCQSHSKINDSYQAKNVQKQFGSINLISYPVLPHPILFIYSKIAISLMPDTYSNCVFYP
jgi:hypothetical protein